MDDRRDGWPGSGSLRIGDRERSAAADRLSAHAAAGRLTVAELEERLDQAGAAVTAADLRAVEADLPGPAVAVRPPLPARRGSGPPVGFLIAALVVTVAASVAVGHPIVPLLVVVVLLARAVARQRPHAPALH